MKSKLLDICMLASLLPKTNIHFKCGTQCSNIQAWFVCSVPALILRTRSLIQGIHAFISVGQPACFMRRSEHM